MGLNGAWKKFEREAARFFGAERTPLSGMARAIKTNSDSMHPVLFIEAKYRAKVKETDSVLWKLYKKVLATARGKVPVLIIRERERAGYLLLLHSKFFDAVAENKPQHTKEFIQTSFATYTLFDDTVAKAAIENKVPVVVLKQKKERGFLLLCKPEHLQTLYHERRKESKENEGGLERSSIGAGIEHVSPIRRECKNKYEHTDLFAVYWSRSSQSGN